MTANRVQSEDSPTPPDRCAHCGSRAVTVVVLPCACGRHHRICGGCRWAWRVLEYTIDPCPLTDEFRVAAEAMGR